MTITIHKWAFTIYRTHKPWRRPVTSNSHCSMHTFT